MATSEIRDSLRLDVLESRQINREKVLGKKRKALNDILDLGRNVTDKEVTIIANKLKTKSAIKVEDLTLLKLSFVQNSRNIVEFLKIKDALHGLVRELTGNKSNHQLLAAECCCNLALGDNKSCLLVAKAAGSYLVTLLTGCNYNLINVSVWTLGNLVGSDDTTWKVVHAQGFLRALLRLIQEHDTVIQNNPEIQENCVNALVQLLLVGSTLLSDQEVELIVNSLINLHNTRVKGLQVAEFLLSCMDSAEEELLKNKTHMKCLKFLEETELNEDNITPFTASVRTIANLVAESSGVCALDLFCNWNLVQDIVQKVFSSPFTHLFSELAWLMGNLMNHPSLEVKSSVEDVIFDFQVFESQYTFLNK